MIRELHVYGRVNPVGHNLQKGAQHLGIGKRLLDMAETISAANGYTDIAVISGIGVRDYYRKRGYHLKDTYMVKSVNKDMDAEKVYEKNIFELLILIMLFILFLSIYAE